MNHDWRVASAPRPLSRRFAALSRGAFPARNRPRDPGDPPEDRRRSAQRLFGIETKNRRVAAAADLRDHEVDVDAGFRERARTRVTQPCAVASALAEAGINIDFVVAQVSGGRYSAIFGFDTEEALRGAAPILRRVARVAGPIAGRKSAARKSRKATRKRARR